MIPSPAEKVGVDNDLNEKIERYIKRAIEEKATIYAFGEGGDQKKRFRICISTLHLEMVYMIFI